ncbi:MAG: tetratricopeptide repeat protein [Phycisphaerae bacterium]|jgi:tetratricopeptide (TPR) repeat protein
MTNALVPRTEVRRSGYATIHRGWWLALLALALAIRGLYLLQYAGNPLFWTPVGPDVEEYDANARLIQNGCWLWQTVGTHGPLYSYVLAGWYALTGQSLLAVRTLQLLLGMLGGIIVTLAVKCRYNSRVAFAVGALWVLYIPAIHYEAELLSEGLALFLNALVIAILLRKPEITPLWAGVVGLLLGLGSITHASALLFGLLILGWLAWVGFRVSARRAAVIVLPALLGLALPTVPVVAYNSHLQGGFVLLQDTGSINLYIGNNPEADGTHYARLGPDWDRIVALPYVAGGVREGPAYNAYFYRQVAKFIFESPGQWLALVGRKAALSVSAQDITASMPWAAIRNDVPMLRNGTFAFGVLLALALAGLVCVREARFRPILLLALAYILSQMIYVASGRYRVPMLPGLFVLGGFGLAHLLESLRTRSGRSLGRAAGALLIGLGVAFLPVVPQHNDDPAEGALVRADAYLHLGDPQRAEADMRQAIALRPDYAMARLFLADLLNGDGRSDEALEQYQAAAAARPDYVQAHLALAEAFIHRNDLAAARPEYLRALELDPENYHVRHLFGRALLVWEDWQGAAEQFGFILSRKPDAQACWGMGESLARLGHYAEAAKLLEQSAAAMPDNARLLAALARLRAACPVDQLRNTEEALVLGARAAALTRFTDPWAVDALSMALANAGHFEQAAHGADIAAEIAGERGDDPLRQQALARRELYLKNKPYRDPPPAE